MVTAGPPIIISGSIQLKYERSCIYTIIKKICSKNVNQSGVKNKPIHKKNIANTKFLESMIQKKNVAGEKKHKQLPKIVAAELVAASSQIPDIRDNLMISEKNIASN